MMEPVTDLAHTSPSRAEKVTRRLRTAAKAVKSRAGRSVWTGPDQHLLSTFKNLHAQYAPLGYQLPWETLEYVELLATYNPDYSQAVENIKMLANSGHTLIVDAQSDLQRKRTKELLETQARNVQKSHGGIDGVISKLMDMAATYGAMSGEWILNEDLTEVRDFVEVNPKTIRFFWEEDVQEWMPYQKVSGAQAKEAEKAGQKVLNGDCVKLNTQTFMYHAFDAAPQSPYGTPPFLAALQNIAIQRDLVFNMAQIVKKIGLLGMIDVSIEEMAKDPGDTDDQHDAKVDAYLDAMAAAAEDMAREGGLAHFSDVKVTTTQLGGNAAGATNIHKANEEMVFSGLKSMPSVQGRSYSTTETYAGVAYDIIIRNTLQYQRGAKRFIEKGYWLMASLSGLNPSSIRLEFDENRSINRAQDATAEQTEIKNAMMLWILGIIDQEGVAHRLGYSEPKIPLTEVPEAVQGQLTAHGVEDPHHPNLGGAERSRANMEEAEDAEVADTD